MQNSLKKPQGIIVHLLLLAAAVLSYVIDVKSICMFLCTLTKRKRVQFVMAHSKACVCLSIHNNVAKVYNKFTFHEECLALLASSSKF